MNGEPFAPAAVADLARRLFGEPNRALSTRGELRFGHHGSLAVAPGKGGFHDHESGASGGVLDLIVHAGAARRRGEAARRREAGGAIPTREPPREADRRAVAEANAKSARIAAAE